ncbi:hypothetical protein [Serinicoccus chungangensis]|uniref:hypothetical protein n=1 Tax=Serinicoccus chungangensis TaxID=767452 RepID=UPI00111859BC|nr:hypothetical protein [Serinicoccus chungangensis]
MTDDDGGDQSPQVRDDIGDPIELDGWVRVLAAVAGVGLGTVGSVALLDGVDGFGSVAIFLASLMLLLLAAAGHVPQRIWGKDMGMILRAREQGRREGAVETAESASEAVSPKELAELVNRLPRNTPDAALWTFIRASAFEQEAMEVLQQSAHNLGAEVIPGGEDQAWDARVVLGGISVNVQFKYRLSTPVLKDLLARAAIDGAVLVVTSYDQSPNFGRRVRDLRRQHPELAFEVANMTIDSVSRHLTQLVSYIKARPAT